MIYRYDIIAYHNENHSYDEQEQYFAVFKIKDCTDLKLATQRVIHVTT